MTKLHDFTMEELMIFCATILASCGVLLKILFTSKCEECNLGCCKIRRRVDLVIAEEKLEKTGHSGETPRLKVPKNLEPEPENP